MTFMPDTGCRECDFLLSQYEATTFSLMRVQNSLTKAEALHDLELIQQLSIEVDLTALRRHKAHQRYSEHRASFHGERSDVDSIIDLVHSHA